MTEVTQNALTVPTEDDPRVVASRTEGVGALDMAHVIIIDSPEMNELANEALTEIKGGIKKVEEILDPIVSPAYKTYKAALALKNKLLEPFENAEKTYKRKIAGWLDYQEVEAKKAAVEAERLRLEMVKKENANAMEVLSSPTTSVDEKLEAASRAEAAQFAIINVPAPAKGKMGSNSSRKVWKAEIKNMELFLAFMARDSIKDVPQFPNTIEIKLGELQKFANVTAGQSPIAGVKFSQERSVTARS